MIENREKLPFWKFLKEQEKELVERSSVLRSYPAGNIIHGNCDGGGSCLGLLYLLSGEIRASILSDEGREITLFRLKAGDVCVLAASCVISRINFDTQISVVEEAKVLVVPASVFGKLIRENIYVKCFLYETTTQRFSSVMCVMQQMLFTRFDQRLASFLLEECRKNNSSRIRMTQEQIAQNVNSSREVVSRMLKQFVTDGLIENRRGEIILKNRNGLEGRLSGNVI